MLSYQTFATFPSLFHLHTLCYFINSCSLIRLSSSYQPSVIFSSLVIYSLLTLSTHPINAPALHTTHTQPSFSSYLAHTLCANTPSPSQQASLAVESFRFGGIETGLGVFSKNNLLPLETYVHASFPALNARSCKCPSLRFEENS